MKKLILYIAAAFVLVSCDMDKSPEGSIPDTDALKTAEKCESFRYGLYSYMRSITTGGFITFSEIQMDDFHAVRGNGNRLMEFYNGNITASTSGIETIYAGYYKVIAQTNFFIGGVREGIANGLYSDEALVELNHYIGEAYFMRAFCYSNLADKFCKSYRNSIANNFIDAEASGLQLQTVYAPSGDNSTYPGRSTLRLTYKQILEDIDEAIRLLTDYETTTDKQPVSMSEFITSDVAKALKARVCLNMGMDQDAANIAKEVIETARYPLSVRNEYNTTLWMEDEGTEVLWRVQMDMTHQGSATGENFLSQAQNPDYIPTQTVTDLYANRDVRLDAFFGDVFLGDGANEGLAYNFKKYPGNPELYATGASSNYSNKSKPFRSSELYLIAAEAYANLGEEGVANAYLSDLRSARIRNSSSTDLTDAELISEIRDERRRELICEGFRMTDLKRWNVGFTRGEMQYDTSTWLYSLNAAMSYDADDHRFVWPIPQSELDANPQIKGQQNPGY